MSVKDKTAVITGGGTGIGWGIAKALATNGCRVVIAGRREDTLRLAADSFEGPPILYHRVDVADRDSVNQLLNWASEQLGQVDILVNSAGLNIKTRTMEEMQPEQWDHVLAVNATGAYNCMHAVLPQMRLRQDGVIVNVNSIAGVRASALGGVAYAASKFAMTALGTAVNNEDCRNGIRVTNLFPGEVNTPILENRPNPVSEEHKAQILQPEDFGEVVVAICGLPARANVSDIVIKPTSQSFV
ncbi:MAG: oxidoreductase [Planctomycetaceae bacterium]|nr:oxidoreductase [Planctomycetaceae bacterium]